jgi:pimeloyl-ACP methyl ester carboxylesterase
MPQIDHIILLHGFCEDHHIWDDMAARLSNSYTVYAPDLAGFGSSAMPSSPDIDQQAALLYRDCTKRGIQQAVLVGHSMGGYIALALCRLYPAFVQGLCLFHSHPFADAPEKIEARQKHIAFVQRNGVEAFVKQLVPNLFAPDFVEQNASVVKQHVAHCIQCAPEAAVVFSLEMMIARPDQSSVMAELACPVLMIVGKQDSAIPYNWSLQQAHLADTTQLVVLDGVGHMGMIEQPETCFQAFDTFLKWIAQG